MIEKSLEKTSVDNNNNNTTSQPLRESRDDNCSSVSTLLDDGGLVDRMVKSLQVGELRWLIHQIVIGNQVVVSGDHPATVLQLLRFIGTYLLPPSGLLEQQQQQIETCYKDHWECGLLGLHSGEVPDYVDPSSYAFLKITNENRLQLGPQEQLQLAQQQSVSDVALFVEEGFDIDVSSDSPTTTSTMTMTTALGTLFIEALLSPTSSKVKRDQLHSIREEWLK
jgi:hypothetical protein